MKQYATTLILWLALLVNEVHTLFSNTRMVTVTGGRVTEQWYVYLLCSGLCWILFFLAWILYVPNRINRTTRAACFLFGVIDLLMFFANFKQHDYESIYTFLFIGWILIYNYGTKNGQRGIVLSEN